MNGVKQVSIYVVVLDKGIFPREEDARNWMTANELKINGPFTDEGLWIFEQRQKADFKLGAFGEGKDFRMVTMGPGVMAVVGELANEVPPRHQADTVKKFSFTKVDDAKRIVTGPVLVPNTVDLQSDFVFPEDIESTAHKFLSDARNIGEMHRKFNGIGDPVESWLLREDWFVPKADGYKIYPKGTWMMAVYVANDDAWKKVLNGELTGFSIGFRGTREEVA